MSSISGDDTAKHILKTGMSLCLLFPANLLKRVIEHASKKDLCTLY